MKEHPIIFSGPMVRAILDARKTQTRRLMKSQPPAKPSGCRPLKIATATDDEGAELFAYAIGAGNGGWNVRCPYGVPGDRLWVRETSRERMPADKTLADTDGGIEIYEFLTTAARSAWTCERWTPAIYMPRWASRITLEIVDVRAQRLQDISEADAKAEGVLGVDWGHGQDYGGKACYRKSFAALWDLIHAQRAPWSSNPWIWALTFRRING